MFITKLMLEQHGACQSSVAIFDKEWPSGVEVTEDNLIRAGKIGLPIEWLVEVMYPQHWDAYDKAVVPLWDAYYKAKTLHKDAYYKAIVPHKDAYDKAIVPHRDAYQKAVVPLWDAYYKAKALHRDAYDKAVAQVILFLICDI